LAAGVLGEGGLGTSGLEAGGLSATGFGAGGLRAGGLEAGGLGSDDLEAGGLGAALFLCIISDLNQNYSHLRYDREYDIDTCGGHQQFRSN
jgi:hypothetical protein